MLAQQEYGVAPRIERVGLRDRIRLSDLHGKTVILAFFYQARTKG